MDQAKSTESTPRATGTRWRRTLGLVSQGDSAVMWVYSLLLGTGLLVSSPWWGARLLVRARYRRGLRERLGQIPERVRAAAQGYQIVWLHAVSVGEVLAAARFAEELETGLNVGTPARAWRVMVSTTTETGQKLARERFGPERVFWFPVDFAWAVRAWMRALQPRLVVLVESELWPRLLRECTRRGTPVAVVNARLSDRSFRRAMRVRLLWRHVLKEVTVFLAQSAETAHRLLALGVDPERVQVIGNLKFDLRPAETPLTTQLRRLLDRRQVVVAGSLLQPEESILLEQWSEVLERIPGAVLVLAPRHPERFVAAAKEVKAPFTLVHATSLQAQVPPKRFNERLPKGAVVLLDTVGDLAVVYGLADVAFVGGSLARAGGHNPLEPAGFGVPVVVGPSYENFREIVSEMQAHGGIRVVHSGEELKSCLLQLLTDRLEADSLGQRGFEVFERGSGATRRAVGATLKLVQQHQPAAGAAR